METTQITVAEKPVYQVPTVESVSTEELTASLEVWGGSGLQEL